MNSTPSNVSSSVLSASTAPPLMYAVLLLNSPPLTVSSPAEYSAMAPPLYASFPSNVVSVSEMVLDEAP